MSVKKDFVKKGIKRPKIEEFLREQFDRCGYSHSKIKRTPVGFRITIYAEKPGLVIGKGGENINKISEKLKESFDFENPRIDVQEIEKPYKNAKIVAEEIKNALERGVNYRKIGHIMKRKVIESGAIGVEIRISGKMSSARGRTERFFDGYLKYSGETAKSYVDYAVTHAITKAGSIGIKVRILKDNPEATALELKEAVEEGKEEEEKEELICPYCGKVYEKERTLKIHIGQKHSEEERKEKKKEKETKKPKKKKEKPKKKEKEKSGEEEKPTMKWLKKKLKKYAKKKGIKVKSKDTKKDILKKIRKGEE